MRPEDEAKDPIDEVKTVEGEDEGEGGVYGLDILEMDADGLLDDGPRTVLITGAAGNIGMKLRAAWEELYDLVAIDLTGSADDPNLIVADLANWDHEWVEHFHGVDTVIHLAGNPNEFSSWEDLQGPNLDVMANVLMASALGGVERVIFASSNHAMGGYLNEGDGPIIEELPPLPDSPYGTTKLMGERMGRSVAHAFELSFIALRLGWNQPSPNHPSTLPHEWGKKMWLSDRDLIQLFECAVEADLGDDHFLVVHGMSNNTGSRWDQTVAAERLGFSPEDNSGA